MKTGRSTMREYLEAILVASLFLLFGNNWVLKTFFIPSGSMLDTLLIGDHLVVNRFIFGTSGAGASSRLLPYRPVQRGDIVVFRSPVDPAMDLVKRCVGLPSDTIEFRDKKLLVNGEPVDEPYVGHTDGRMGGVDSIASDLMRRDQFGPYVVPAEHLFCVGDNRDESYDSRFWGPVPYKFVEGRASVIYWSYGGDPPPIDAHALAPRLRSFLATASGFFTKSRWSRTFLLPR